MRKVLQIKKSLRNRIEALIDHRVLKAIADIQANLDLIQAKVEQHAKLLKEIPQGPTIYTMTNRFSDVLRPGKASPNSLFGSSLCRMEDMIHPAYQQICRNDLKVEPNLHRKQWEYVYIIHQLRSRGVLREGATGLGFGVGTEALASLFASNGCNILATDAPDDLEIHGWQQTAQHANTLKQIWHENLIPWELFARNCRFQPLDMNNYESIPSGFDFHWSSCVIEHLGGISSAKEFILASVSRLAKNGVAVHTTEFNLSSDIDTIDMPGTCILRACDIIEIQNCLEQRGFLVDPVTFDPGIHPYNYHIDAPPYDGNVHLRLLLESYASTSIGLVIQKIT